MNELKLVTYNIKNGEDERQLLRNIKDLAEQNAQVFCLQEVRPPKNSAFFGNLVLETLGPQWQGEFFLSEGKYLDYGLALLWKKDNLEMVRFEKIYFSVLEKLQLHERLYEMFYSGYSKPVARGALIGIFKFNNKLLRISNVHLDWHGRFKQRFGQLEHLLGHLKGELSVDGDVICGDFNTLGFFRNEKQMKKIQALLGEEFVSSMSGFRTTTVFYQQLDHVFARNLKIQHSRVLEVSGSDHYPIIATIAL